MRISSLNSLVSRTPLLRHSSTTTCLWLLQVVSWSAFSSRFPSGWCTKATKSSSSSGICQRSPLATTLSSFLLKPKTMLSGSANTTELLVVHLKIMSLLRSLSSSTWSRRLRLSLTVGSTIILGLSRKSLVKISNTVELRSQISSSHSITPAWSMLSENVAVLSQVRISTRCERRRSRSTNSFRSSTHWLSPPPPSSPLRAMIARTLLS